MYDDYSTIARTMPGEHTAERVEKINEKYGFDLTIDSIINAPQATFELLEPLRNENKFNNVYQGE